MPIQNFDIPEDEYSVDILINLMNRIKKMDLQNPEFANKFCKQFFFTCCKHIVFWKI